MHTSLIAYQWVAVNILSSVLGQRGFFDNKTHLDALIPIF